MFLIKKTNEALLRTPTHLSQSTSHTHLRDTRGGDTTYNASPRFKMPSWIFCGFKNSTDSSQMILRMERTLQRNTWYTRRTNALHACMLSLAECGCVFVTVRFAAGMNTPSYNDHAQI